MAQDDGWQRMHELLTRIINGRFDTFCIFLDDIVLELGEERANVVFQNAAASLRSDMYQTSEETLVMFLKRKQMEFLRDLFLIDKDETGNERDREFINVHDIIVQYLTPQEQEDLFIF